MLNTAQSLKYKTRKVRLVENSVQRVARMLSQQYGIRVVWNSEGKCFTDGKTINLPALPDDAPDLLLEAIQGYLDHETAHILFTDFKAQRVKNLTPEEFSCVNAVEDLRIEQQISILFPGSPYNLRKAHDWMVARFQEHWDKITQFNKAICGVVSYGRYGETEFWTDVADDETKVLVLEGLKAVGPLDQIRSTEDSIDAGLRLYEVLKEHAEEEKERREEEEKKKKQGGGGQGGEDKGGGGQGEEDEEGVPQPGLSSLGASISKVSSEVIKSVATGQQVKLPGGGNYQHNQQSDSSYLIWDTSLDTYDKFTRTDERKLAQLRGDAADLTHVMKTRLVNSLRASAQRRWVGGKEEGKLDSRRLHRAVMGLGDDVFKQRTSKPAINTVVGLAIDHSGSMHGRKIDLASESAIVIGDVLNALRIPFMAYGYSTHGYSRAPSNTALYARWNGLWIRYYRQFQEPWTLGASRLASASDNIKENTLDGESVKYGVQQLLLRPEKRKILFVFNDGAPYPGHGHTGRCQEYLLDVVDAAKKAGVEVVAFGIQDDSVKHYYHNYVVIRNLQDLVKEPLQILDSMLRKGMTLR